MVAWLRKLKIGLAAATTPLLPLAVEVAPLASNFSSVVFSLVSRVCNSLAHNIAK